MPLSTVVINALHFMPCSVCHWISSRRAIVYCVINAVHFLCPAQSAIGSHRVVPLCTVSILHGWSHSTLAVTCMVGPIHTPCQPCRSALQFCVTCTFRDMMFSALCNLAPSVFMFSRLTHDASCRVLRCLRSNQQSRPVQAGLEQHLVLWGFLELIGFPHNY